MVTKAQAVIQWRRTVAEVREYFYSTPQCCALY